MSSLAEKLGIRPGQLICLLNPTPEAAAALRTDLVDNKIASVTDDEYGTRFVIRKERRPRPQRPV